MPAKQAVPVLSFNEKRVLLFIGDGSKADKDGFTDGRHITDFSEGANPAFLHFDPLFKIMDTWHLVEQPKGTRANKFRLTEFGEYCYGELNTPQTRLMVGFSDPTTAVPAKPATKKKAESQDADQPSTDAANQSQSEESDNDDAEKKDESSPTSKPGTSGNSDGRRARGSQAGGSRPHRS